MVTRFRMSGCIYPTKAVFGPDLSFVSPMAPREYPPSRCWHDYEQPIRIHDACACLHQDAYDGRYSK